MAPPLSSVTAPKIRPRFNWEKAGRADSISARLKLGDGQPEAHDGHTNNLFLDTRGLPKPATGDQARYILQRFADSSRPFGTTVEVKGETAVINLSAGN
jgi:hypothetical protein